MYHLGVKENTNQWGTSRLNESLNLIKTFLTSSTLVRILSAGSNIDLNILGSLVTFWETDSYSVNIS